MFRGCEVSGALPRVPLPPDLPVSFDFESAIVLDEDFAHADLVPPAAFTETVAPPRNTVASFTATAVSPRKTAVSLKKTTASIEKTGALASNTLASITATVV